MGAPRSIGRSTTVEKGTEGERGALSERWRGGKEERTSLREVETLHLHLSQRGGECPAYCSPLWSPSLTLTNRSGVWEEKIFGSLTLVDWTEIHLMKGFLGKERIKVNHTNGLGFINFPPNLFGQSYV